MSEVLKEWDTRAVLDIAEIEKPTPRDMALVDRFLQIHQGDSAKAGLALKRYNRTGNAA